jgi:hypothetical protein
MSNVITRSKKPLKIARTKITSKNPITEDVLKVMIDIIKDDLITRIFSEEESIQKEDNDIYRIYYCERGRILFKKTSKTS